MEENIQMTHEEFLKALRDKKFLDQYGLQLYDAYIKQWSMEKIAALQGTNSSATNTAILAAIGDMTETLEGDYASQLQAILGVDTDTSEEETNEETPEETSEETEE